MKYIKGDATHMQGGGNKILAHIVNNRGGWGKGFVLAVSKKWKEPEQAYRNWYKNRGKPVGHWMLGLIQCVPVEKYIWVVNMLCQDGFKGNSNPIPLKYDALKSCVKKLAIEAKRLEASVHMPRIGCGLAGGDWNKIEPILIEELSSQNISVLVYDFD